MKKKLVRAVQETAKREGLFHYNQRILIACSGGPDSLALLYCLADLRRDWQFELGAICIDHGLRVESKDEVELVRTHANTLGISFYTYAEDVQALALARNESVETAGRYIRYYHFQEVAQAHEYEAIAVAHHKDDQAETILAHLIRGSGARGAGGMKYKAGNIIRPMLDVTKRDIEDYLALIGVDAAIDKTNFETDYQRNKIRWHIIPELKKINPNVVESLTRFGQNMQMDEAYLQEQVKSWWQKILISEDPLVINRTQMRLLPCALERRMWPHIWEYLKMKNDIKGLPQLEQTHIVQLMNISASHEPKEFALGKVKVFARYDKIQVGQIITNQ